MSESRWQDIYKHLVKEGFDAYSPGQHEGECITPYVVIKDAGATQYGNFSSTRNLYDIMCYVPKEQFSQLEPFVQKLQVAMIKMYPVIRPTHYKTPSFYDDTVKGHMISVQYLNYKKI